MRRPTVRFLLPVLPLVVAVLVACGGDEPAPPAVTTPSTEASSDVVTEPSPTPSADPRYDTCAEATEAGYGPYRRDEDPEYGWYEDRDGDGVVCETE